MPSPRRSARRWAPSSPDLLPDSGAPGVPDATADRYASGVWWQGLGRGAQAIGALVGMAVLTRTLGLEAVGIFATYEALFTLLDIVVDGGTGAALVRRAGARPISLRPLIRRSLLFRFRSGTLAVFLALGFAAADPRVEWNNPGLLFAAAALISHLAGAYGAIWQLRLDFRFPALVRSVASALGCAVLLFLAAHGETDPLTYLAALAASRAVGNAALWWVGRSRLRSWPAREDPEGVRGFEREALVLGGGWLAREAYGRLDLLLLRFLGGAAAAGLYGPVRKTFTLATQLPAFFANVALPALARESRQKQGFQQATKQLCLWLMAVAVVGIFVAYLLAGPFLAWAFGPAWEEGAASLKILALANLAVFPAAILISALIAQGRARRTLRISLEGLGLAAAGSLILIPSLGILGAAWARLIVEVWVAGRAAAALR